MKNKNFWDISQRPYTQLKLKILGNYLCECWAKIFFSQASKHKEWKSWQEIYYIDCFAGRGKYHKDGIEDSFNGSPLIALECAKMFQRDSRYKGVKMKCIFVECKKNISNKLLQFCDAYKGVVDFEIYKNKDINIVIDKILADIKNHPSFFFIDPDGIKELRKETIEKIVNRDNAPTDILLNYIKGGVERISGLVKKEKNNIINKNISEKSIKTIKRLVDFYGLEIFKHLDKTEVQKLKEWTNSILKSSNLKEIAVFDMPYSHKSDNIYYLLFASRKPVAKKIMTGIFKDAKRTNFNGQARLDIFGEREFDI